MVIQAEVRFSPVRLRRLLGMFLFFFVLCAGCIAQDAAARKIKTRVAPVYPELARKLSLAATVKVQVTVAPNGTVTQAKAMGGHPLLVDPAVIAAKQFRYEPGDETMTTIIEFHFAPGND